VKVFGFAGYSGSGKTTLIEQLIPRFVARGLRVSLIKHAHHAFDIDKPGKDSYRHREAGASEVLITSTQTITALTISLNGATAVFGSPTTLQAGAAVRLRFYSATNSWYSIITDSSPFGAAIQAFLATPNSANLRTAVTDETGSGALVFANTPTLVTPDLGAATGTSVTTTGSQLVSGTGKQGYATGAGGVVTQGSGSGKATAVTLSKSCGSITMDGALLAAATTVSFTLTNTTIEAGDILVMNHLSGGTAGAYTLNAQCAAGSAVISLRNVTAGGLTEAPVIRFAVVKAVSA